MLSGMERMVTAKMTTKQLHEAMELARAGRGSMNDIDIFNGFGLPTFRKVTCSIEALAGLLRWQCFRFDGSIDEGELEIIAQMGKHKFIIV